MIMKSMSDNHDREGFSMRRIALLAAFAALLAVPAFSLADPSPADQATAQKQCRDQRAAIGDKAFKDLYGTNKNKSNAFGKCVSKLASANAADQANAAKACRAEQALDPAAFKAKYGTGKNKANAFGKCVSQKAQAQEDQQQEATINAAKTCKAERALDPVAFKAKYGTNKNKSNAFGKCVSQHAKAQSD